MAPGRPCSTFLPGIIIFCFIAAGCGQQRFTDVEFVATPQLVVNEMLNMARVTKDDVVYDLGCGDGRIVITAAKMFGARGVGVDLDPALIKISNDHARQKGVTDLVKFVKGDFFRVNLKEATVVALYLTPELNVRLRPQLFRELKPGARVITNDFSMGEWTPDDMGRLGDVRYEYPDKTYNRDAYVYCWTIPADVSGRWRFTLDLSNGKQDFTLRLSQKFQQINGTISSRGRTTVIAETRLEGKQIRFTVRDETLSENTIMWFNGRTIGNSIEGMVEIPQEGAARHYHWLATREQ